MPELLLNWSLSLQLNLNVSPHSEPLLFFIQCLFSSSQSVYVPEPVQACICPSFRPASCSLSRTCFCVSFRFCVCSACLLQFVSAGPRSTFCFPSLCLGHLFFPERPSSWRHPDRPGGMLESRPSSASLFTLFLLLLQLSFFRFFSPCFIPLVCLPP